MIRRVLIVLFLVSGCQLMPQTPTPTLTLTATAPSITATAAPSVTVVPSPTATPILSSLTASGLLIWMGTGSDPTRATGGQIAMLDLAGGITPLLDVPKTATRITACGDPATSPDGRMFAFYVGGDTGSLYLMNLAQAPIQVDNVSYLACLNGLRYSPDSQKFAYIDYAAGATRSDYAAGMLRLYNTNPLEQVTQFDNTVAFQLNNDSLNYVSFFADSKGQADEASVSTWDSQSEREIVTLVPTEPDCRFISAQISQESTQLLVMLGQRCPTGDTATHWQLYTIDPATSAATLVGTDAQPAAFVTFARTNNLYIAPNGSTAYFTVPDAVTAYTVAIAALSLKDYSISIPVERQAVFPNFSGAPEAFPRLSPDGRWLALIVTSPDSENQLLALDLNAPDSSPLTGGQNTRNNDIPDLAFSPDSQHLLYLAGGVDNALNTLDLTTGANARIMRGNFVEAMAVSPDGHTVALLNTLHVDDPHQPAYLNLVLADLDSTTMTTLYPGADVAGGKVTNLRFAYPLTWR